ncbi:MAG: ABC transporter permease [Bacteroides sp.]|nr:ABC transporter permease [Bacteroides sp.]
MNLRTLLALLRKELTIMRHDPLVPRIILMMPLMVMLVAPLVTNLDVTGVNVAVVDNDRSMTSRRIVADLASVTDMKIIDIAPTYTDAIIDMEHGEADVIVTIPPHFARDFSAIDIEANGVNAMKGMLGSQYVSSSIAGSLAAIAAESGRPAPAATSVINRFNPTLNYRNYMIPALMVILLIVICGFLPALSIVREKETGTIEAMNVTPVSRFVFVLSKLIPYWLAGMLVITVGLVVGRAVYGLAPEGNIAAIYLAAILLSLVMSGMGVIVANSSDTMLQSIFVLFAFVIIFQLMGGLFTPISSMPDWAQAITYAIPPRYFIEILRAIYLKGATVGDLWMQYTILGSFAVVLCLLAALTYRKQS